MFLRGTAASEVFELDQHGQGTFKFAIQVRFVARKLLQPVGLQPFSNGLVHDRVVVAGLFFLLVDKRCNALSDECCQTRGVKVSISALIMASLCGQHQRSGSDAAANIGIPASLCVRISLRTG